MLRKPLILKVSVEGHLRTVLLDQDTYDIGRSKRCAIQLDHPEVSRFHARLVCYQDGRIQLLDGDGQHYSSNGTCVNDEPITSCWLEPGDRIMFGTTLVTAHLESSEADEIQLPEGFEDEPWAPGQFPSDVGTSIVREDKVMPPAPSPMDPYDRIRALEAELAQTQTTLQQQQGQYRELQTELENLRQRIKREARKAIERERQAVILEILAVADSFELAQRSVTFQTEQEFRIHQGYQKVARLLTSILERLGVSRITTEDQQFDPALHEAIGVDSSTGRPEDMIVAEHQAGYRMNNRVIRAAKVTVAGH